MITSLSRSTVTINNSRASVVKNAFDLADRVAVITGGAGLLGIRHAEAIAEMGGIPVLVDLDCDQAMTQAAKIGSEYGVKATGLKADITKPEDVSNVLASVLENFRRIDILINNAANNPKMDAATQKSHASRLEKFSLETWNADLAVGLTGAFLCSQIIGAELARRGKGVVLNIASDLSVIAPDQRIYQDDTLLSDEQPVKPISYSVVKHGLIGLTRYLATYWANRGVRVNALSPGGVYADQEQTFVRRLTNLIPMGRMAHQDEYEAAIVFMVSDASSYMTGANVLMDGGRTVW